jgi:hypothetical protein
MLVLVMQAPRFESPSCVDGQVWAFVIRERDVSSGPRWTEADEAPPLTPRAALRSARAFLGRMTCRQPDAWEVHQISLQPIAGERDMWVYVVEFVQPLHVPKDTLIGSSLRRGVSVVVLLDGTVVVPSVGLSPPRR